MHHNTLLSAKVVSFIPLCLCIGNFIFNYIALTLVFLLPQMEMDDGTQGLLGLMFIPNLLRYASLSSVNHLYNAFF